MTIARSTDHWIFGRIGSIILTWMGAFVILFGMYER